MSSSKAAVSNESIKRLAGRLVVSCQASAGEPLCAPEYICALALSAIAGGAGGLRLEGAGNVAYVRLRVTLPIVGLTKAEGMTEDERLHKVYITPCFEDAAALSAAGADIIALDATDRPRPGGMQAGDLIARIKSELNKPVWADVSTFEEGALAAESGADVVSTTMAGYTAGTRNNFDAGPDFWLLEKLCRRLALPVVLEGKVWKPEEVTHAFKLGAYAVVVGSAITRPQLITRRFVKAIPLGSS